MKTITTLITGSSLDSRLELLEDYQQDLPRPPHTLDGRQSAITIESIRQFQHDINLLPPEDTLQRHFIIEAQNISLPGQQALLKTLEEPPTRTQIILTSDHSHSLLETILSRCHHVDIKPDSPKTNFKDSQELLKTIMISNHGQLIKLASSMSGNEPKKDLIQLLHFFRHHLPDKPTIARAKAAKTIQQTLANLETNANKQIILEHLFFTLKSLSKR